MSLHGGNIYNANIDYDFSVNLNPLGIPDNVKSALYSAVEEVSNYPELLSNGLKQAIADFHNLSVDKVVCGNGASEIISNLIKVLKPKKALIPVPSFSGYTNDLTKQKIKFHELKEKYNFDIRIDILKELDDVDLVILANPNNPTGRTIDNFLLKKIVQTCNDKGINVILDECFIDFTKEKSLVSELRFYNNLFIIRAFTKTYSIPGVRLGYVLSDNTKLLAKLQDSLPEWNVSIFAQKAGIAALQCDDFRKQTISTVTKERNYLVSGLQKELEDIKIIESVANFILFKTDFNLYEFLYNRKILIRDCSNFENLEQGYYRIAVKDRRSNKALLNTLHYSKLNISQQIEQIKPSDIEKRSFSIIDDELKARGVLLQDSEKLITMRVIHTTADFDYLDTLTFSNNAQEIAISLLKEGAHIVTDTNMGLSGINKTSLSKCGGEVHCFMSDPDIIEESKETGVTRAYLSMQKAKNLSEELNKPFIFAIGNAPTALISLYELMESTGWKPAFIIGVPVGFVNVVQSKELFLNSDIPYIINRGRKGGSNVAAAICNAILYQIYR